MNRYYADDAKTVINVTLLSDDAEAMAKKLVRKDDKGGVDGKNSISSSQLRRFYGEFKGLQRKIASGRGFEPVLPLVKMVKSKVAYASSKVPGAFQKWLTEHVEAISDEQDFQAFMLHFEAVVGFCYGLGLRNN